MYGNAAYEFSRRAHAYGKPIYVILYPQPILTFASGVPKKYPYG
jgi:hypothetical protein